MGRRTLCTTDRIKRICTALRSGAFIRNAAQMGGVTEACYYKWRRRGEAELARIEDGEEPLESEAIYVTFVEESTRAIAQAEMTAVAEIQAIARSMIKDTEGNRIEVDPRTRLDAHKFFLERRFRREWGKTRQTDDINTEDVELELVLPSPAHLGEEDEDDHQRDD